MYEKYIKLKSLTYALYILGFSLTLPTLTAAPDLKTIIMPILAQELEATKQELDQNLLTPKDQINLLKSQLDQLFDRLLKEDYAEDSTLNDELRSAYIITQGMIESSITKAVERGLIKNPTITIVTPRMPSPFLLTEGAYLKDLNLNNEDRAQNALSLAAYRNLILIRFFNVGGQIAAYYAYDAREKLSNQGVNLEVYDNYKHQYPYNLLDQFHLDVAMDKFPESMTGAVYVVDRQYITIQSLQADQINQQCNFIWSIKFRSYADQRQKEVGDYIRSVVHFIIQVPE